MLVTFDTKRPKSSKNGGNSTGGSVTEIENSLINEVSDIKTHHSIFPDPKVVQNVSVKGTDSKGFKFTKRRTNEGCLTCKIRKKKCSEKRPVCADCERLGKNCVWATDDMSSDMIKRLKKKVEEAERTSKGKRKLHTLTEEKGPSERKLKREKKSVKTNPAPESNVGSTTAIPSFNEVSSAFQRHEELLQRSQTPIASHLMQMSSRQNSPLLQPSSPSHMISTSTLSDVPHDKLIEFSSFFETNLRENMRRSSNRMRPLDENEHEIQEFSLAHVPSISSPSLSPSASSFPGISENYDIFSSCILPSLNPDIPALDSTSSYFYDYYVNRLSGIVSIVPPESNYYLKFFLPMAAKNEGILNAILAWSAYHVGGDCEREGSRYMAKALDYVQETPASTDSEILQRLANLLIMAAAEICKGDVKRWPAFLEWGSQIIKQRGGLFNFKKNTEQHWLISNFAYHDILTSSSSERGTYFPVEDYQNFMVSFGSGIDPLQGIIKPLFGLIGEISSLAFETKRLLKISANSLGYGILDEENGNEIENNEEEEEERDDDDDEEEDDLYDIPGIETPESDKGKKVSRYTSLLTIMSRSSELENSINDVKPDPEDLSNFNPQELELQLTLFELFQLTAKLHLRQSVLRLNPSSLETQFILCELLKCLDIVLKSSVEGSLCFPLFIAGMNCTTRRDRKMMLERFNDIITRYSFKNLERARSVMEQVWLIDPSGTRCVDWYEIVKKLNWDLSFA